MKPQTAGDESRRDLLQEITDYLCMDDLCLEVRHYSPDFDSTNDAKLHLLIIMKREITQPEWRCYIDKLNEIADRHGIKIDCLFSSPKTWREMKTLISPFTRIDRKSIIDWQRPKKETMR